MSPLKRKARIAILNLRICHLRCVMSREGGITDQWKAMARRMARLAAMRNALLTPAEMRKYKQGRTS